MVGRRRRVSCAGVWAVVFAAEPAKRPAAAPQPFETAVLPFVKRYCLDCHSGADAERGVQLDKYRTAAAVSEDRATWRKVLEHAPRPQDAARGQPPPERRGVSTRSTPGSKPRLALARRERAGPPDPGRVTIRRLNRTEYTNTIRDLLGVEFNAAADFPSDDVGYGFDNIGDVLTLPPLLMEKYLGCSRADRGQGHRRGQAGRETRRLPAVASPHLLRRSRRERSRPRRPPSRFFAGSPRGPTAARSATRNSLAC